MACPHRGVALYAVAKAFAAGCQRSNRAKFSEAFASAEATAFAEAFAKVVTEAAAKCKSSGARLSRAKNGNHLRCTMCQQSFHLLTRA